MFIQVLSRRIKYYFLNIKDNLNRCLTKFCWIQRSQIFIDGNKRVANLVTNKEKIKYGQGIIAIPIEKNKLILTTSHTTKQVI